MGEEGEMQSNEQSTNTMKQKNAVTWNQGRETLKRAENSLQRYLIVISKRMKVGSNISCSRKYFITDT